MSRECPICGAETVAAGSKRGTFIRELFELRHCVTCRFSHVANPATDYQRIYGEEYYNGRGADPSVDYVFELEHPDKTVRIYEWRGILKLVRSLTAVNGDTQWLDFGCGNGGLVRYCREHAGKRLCRGHGETSHIPASAGSRQVYQGRCPVQGERTS